VKYQYHKEASQELEESATWYEQQASQLGGEFVQEVGHAIQRILDAPETFELYDGELRRCPVRRFPYHLLYRVRESTIEIVCVMHGSRRPGYWKKRLD